MEKLENLESAMTPSFSSIKEWEKWRQSLIEEVESQSAFQLTMAEVTRLEGYHKLKYLGSLKLSKEIKSAGGKTATKIPKVCKFCKKMKGNGPSINRHEVVCFENPEYWQKLLDALAKLPNLQKFHFDEMTEIIPFGIAADLIETNLVTKLPRESRNNYQYFIKTEEVPFLLDLVNAPAGIKQKSIKIRNKFYSMLPDTPFTVPDAVEVAKKLNYGFSWAVKRIQDTKYVIRTGEFIGKKPLYKKV